MAVRVATLIVGRECALECLLHHLAALATTLVLGQPGAVPADAASSPLQFRTLVADPSGPDKPGDNKQINRETIVVKNVSKKTVNLVGYTIKDKQNHTYVFPKGSTLKPGKSVTVHTGKGTNSSTHVYWKQGNYVWNNTGDTATLRNAKGTKLDTCVYKENPKGTTNC